MKPKILSDAERKKRSECDDLYFKSGKPKKQYMLCRDPEYIREIVRINGRYDINWTCGGNRCPYYSLGCDDKGRDWD